MSPRELHATASAAFPEIILELEDFAAFVHETWSLDPALVARHAHDLFLACAAAKGDARAVAEIDRACLANVAAMLPRRKLGPSDADEIAQRARDRLFVGQGGAAPKIAEYGGRGPLAAWIRVVVTRIEATHRKRSRPHESLDERTHVQLVAASPEHLLAQARWQRAFDEALREAFDALPRDDRALFRLQFGKGLTLDQIAQLLGIHRATTARRIAAAREQLWTSLCGSLRARLALPQREVEALIAQWRSQLEISLSGLLRESAAP